ncbi:MAG: ATP-binding protein [Roseobacter sp.]
MNHPSPDVSTLDEGGLIAQLIHARLDQLEGRDADPSLSEQQLSDRRGGARITKLCALFGASASERAVLMSVTAPLFDPTIIQRYVAVTGRGWVTDWLVELLFPEHGAILSDTGFLARWGVLEIQIQGPGEPPAIVAAQEVKGWIAGQTGVPKSLAESVSLIRVPHPLPDWPITKTASDIQAALTRKERVCLAITALEGSGRASFAGCIAAAAGQRAVLVDPARMEQAWSRVDTVAVHRTALVLGAALVWRGLPKGDALCPLGLWPAGLQAVTLSPGGAFSPLADLATFEVALPTLKPGDRIALIDKYVPGAAEWDGESRAALGDRSALTPGAIIRLARSAPQSGPQALTAVNSGNAGGMGDLAQRMPGDLDWDDLVLPEMLKNDLCDLAFEARAKAATFKDPEIARLFRRESGLVSLFHGAPGTGKTMAAQVLAQDLGLDLYRIDCSTVVSKYIGETAKNMKQVFARARAIDAVLFFDEADALFAKRTEVKDSHDRHANTDTSYLLQLIEGEFEGVAVLATNRLGDMDPAFLRRIRYIFEIPRPDATARCELWRRAGAALANGAEAALWDTMGDVLDFTGAQIKTCLLTAHFMAQRRGATLTAQDILRAADREMAKEGRSLRDRDRERIKNA